MNVKGDFSRKLLHWYSLNKRNLPWRGSADPYRIWVAEIIFQQTRIEQGLDYFHRFMSRFPDLESLAGADEVTVLKLWQGLGYYSRARNMMMAARQLQDEYGGKFPETEKELRRLKGIGEYTAACLASVCFSVPSPAVDGNVTRVISRFYAIDEAPDSQAGKKLVRKFALNLMDQNHPGDFNEAMMDLGALICKPAAPLCVECPLSGECKAFAVNRVSSYPLKRKSILRRQRWFNYFLILKGESILIRKRTEQDVWKGLYELPVIEGDDPEEFSGLFRSLSDPLYHKLTHQVIRISFYELTPEQFIRYENGEEIMVRVDELDNFPFPKPVSDFLKKMFGRENH